MNNHIDTVPGLLFLIAILLGWIAFVITVGPQVLPAVAALTPPATAPIFRCEPPIAQGDIALITVGLEAGQLRGECDYIVAPKPAPKAAPKRGG